MKNVLFNSVLVAFVLLVASCGKQPEAKVEVMSFNIRLDHVADSMNNWKYRKDNAAQMIAYYAPDIVGMQEVVKNQLNDLKERLPQYTALGVGRADGEEKGEYCSLFYKTERFELLKNGDFGLSDDSRFHRKERLGCGMRAYRDLGCVERQGEWAGK